MAFAWDLFAEEIGRVGQRAGARVAQRGIDKRAEERAYRMHEERLRIEEPFKELSDKRLQDRQEDLARLNKDLKEDFHEWQSDFNRKLDIFAGSEGYQETIKRARKDGDLSQVTIMQMEDVIMRLRRGEVPDEKDMAVFEALQPFDRLPIMDLFKQNQMVQMDFAQKQQRIDNAATALQNEATARAERVTDRGLIDMKRWMDMRRNLDADAEKAETAFSEYRSELFGELEDAGKINVKGEAFSTIGGKKKVKLINPDTGEVNDKATETFVKRYPRYRGRFKRLEVLRQNVKDRNEARDEFFGGVSTGVSNTWTGSDGKTYEIGKFYTIGGKKVKCIGENQFEPVK